ncbi:11808_t:CDS:1, partial [Diversispora eburnea]
MAFKKRELDGFNESINCKKCKKRKSINLLCLCRRCNAMNSLIVDSGNENIDDFIKVTQFTRESVN